jgi:murein L,D-transpeptidase YafK
MDLWSRIADWRAAAAVFAILGCQSAAQGAGAADAKAAAPVPWATRALMSARDTTAEAPILVRAFKMEAELEIWKQTSAKRFVLLKTFPICRWSGQLGPKSKTGDRQTPEGFYSVAANQMNPNSAYYLSFDTGYPNAFDKARGASGSYVMVHGTCSSAGCYAMTDKGVGEIYAIARDALKGGQQAFQFQAYPFRMSAQNMAKHRADPNIGFWRQLKEGFDRFEATREELTIGVSAGRYAFAPSPDPAKEALAQTHHAEEMAKIAALVAEGGAAVRTTYADGGQHPAFAALARQGTFLGEISRPEALAYAGLEEIITPARPKRRIVAARPAPADAIKDALPPDAAPPLAGALASPASRSASLFENAAFAQAPFCYKLELRMSIQASMSGAMPILPAVLIN